jgi:hypothetical protein
MHHPSATASRSVPRRLVFLTMLAVLLVLALAQAAPVLAASVLFDGGPVAADTATTLANDHTVYALRFSNTSASANPAIPDGTYYVKVRLTPNADGSPAGTDNRGFTWNGASGSWVQEREDWILFPTVTVTGGLINTSGTSPWFYCKFGDTTKSGTYRVLISLSTGAAGTTRNSSTTIPVTLIDPTSTAAWVHSGVSTSKTNGKRVVVVAHQTPADPSQIPVANERTELNTVDDDSDGIVDNEMYGPVQAGGFRMAVPTSQALDVALQDALWPAASTGFTIATADTDIALGATEQTAPTVAASPSAVTGDAGATISWTAASDDTAVAGYYVYRWIDAPAGAGYTPLPARVGTVTTGTTYSDTGLTNGTTYHYYVRAYDAATNVGPRSATVDATPIGATTLTLGATPTTVAWGKHWTLSGALAGAAGAAVPDASVKLLQSVGSGAWTLLSTLSPAAGTSTYTANVAAPTQKTTYKLVYEGTDAYADAISDPVTVTPRVKLGHPVAPPSVKKKKSFAVYGALTPKANAGSKTVKVKCYLKKSGKWVLKKTVTTKNSSKGSASQYKASMSLPSKGSWKLVASAAATSKYAATTSSPEYLKVR